jgi:serine/threonine-protein kinase
MSGVAAAHREGVLHRDLKLDNIFVCIDKSGAFTTTKVLDFGISKLTDPHAYEVGQITRTGQVMGTPHCMAPEQVLDEPSVDARVDVYALGVILYELLSGGRLPYEAENYNRLVVAITTGPGTPLRTYCPDHDPALIAVVEQAIAHDRRARFESVDAFAAALEPFAEGARFSSPSGQFVVSARTSHTPTLTPSELAAARRSVTPVQAVTPVQVVEAPMPEARPSLIPGERPLPVGLFAGVLVLVVLGLAAIWWSSADGASLPASSPTAVVPLASPDAAASDAGVDAFVADAPVMTDAPEPTSPEPTAMEHTSRTPSHPAGETPRPTMVSPPDRTITGRSGVLDPDDF